MPKVKLGEVATEYKSTIKNNDGYPVVGLEHFTPGDISLNAWNSGIETTFTKGFKKGQMLFGRRRAYLKKAAVAPFDGVCSGDIIVIEPIGGKILPELLPFIIQNDLLFDFAMSKSAGGMSPRVKWKDLKEYEFELPEFKEQDRILEALQSAYQLKKSYQDLITATDELVKSQFIEMFGGSSKEVRFSDYVWFQEGPGVRSKDFTDDGVILLTGSNINNNQISFGYNSDRHISHELANGKYHHFMCDKNDILAVTSAIAPEKFDEKVVLVNTDKEYCLNTGIIRFKPDLNHLTRGYLMQFMKSDYFKRQVSINMAGICQMHFGPSHLKMMTLLLPDSIEDQEEFEEFVKQSDKSKIELNQAISSVDAFIKSVVQQGLDQEQ